MPTNFNQFMIRVKNIPGGSITSLAIRFLLPDPFTLSSTVTELAPLTSPQLAELQNLLLVKYGDARPISIAAKLVEPLILGANATYGSNGFAEDLNYTLDFFGFSYYKYQRYQGSIFLESGTNPRQYAFKLNLVDAPGATGIVETGRPAFAFGRTTSQANRPWIVGPSVLNIVLANTLDIFGQVPAFGPVDLETSISNNPGLTPDMFDDAQPNFFSLQQKQITSRINDQGALLSGQITTVGQSIDTNNTLGNRKLDRLQRSNNIMIFFIVGLTVLSLGFLLIVLLVLLV